MKRSIALICAVVSMAIVPSVSAGSRQSAEPDQDWLGWVNHLRALADMPAVAEDPALTDGAAKHARYMAETGDFSHSEDPSSPWYTPEGDAAARASELTRGSIGRTPRDMIETWASEIFHGTWVVEDRLTRAGFASDRGYGVFYDGDLDPSPTPVTYPIVWPSDGSSLWITTMGNESPDPETTCPGATGVALKVAFPSTPNITSTSLSSDGVPVDHCSFDETNYVNPDPGSQSLARAILGSVHMVALIPQSPLVPGKTYTASITNGSQTTTWSFNVVDRTTVTAPVVPTPPPTITSSPSPTHSGGTVTSPGTGSTSITLAANSSRVRYGRTLKLSGQVSREGCEGDLNIQITRRVLGSSNQRVVEDDIAMIGPGSFEVSFPADHSASYVASVDPAGDCSPSTSAPRTVLVPVLIRAGSLDGCPGSPQVQGRVLPEYPGTKVVLKNRRGRTIDRDELDPASRFVLRPRTCEGGLRIQWPSQDEANAKGSKKVGGG